jgi:hypothetical protein
VFVLELGEVMTKMRSVVCVLFVMVALACGDDSSDNPAGSAGTAGGIAGTGGVAGGVAGTGGAGDSGGLAGMGTAGVAGMAGMGGTGGTAGTSGTGGTGGTGGTAGGMPDCFSLPGGPPQPTFTWFFETVTPNCAGPLCHSGPAGGGLMFDAGNKDGAYAQLMMMGMAMNLGTSTSMVNCKDTGLTRVVPMDPDASLLYAKLRTDMDPPCGNRMPTGSKLCQDALDAIRMWIMSGAPNN